MIACSRMYNVAPAVRAAWDLVFAHAAEVSGVKLEIVAHPAPAPLEELWTRPDLGAAFLSLDAEPAMRPVLDGLLLKRFAAVDPAAYEMTRRRAEAAPGW